MDGDAWGSLWGLYLILKNMKKDVRAINDDTVPSTFSFLWNQNIIEPELDVAAFAPELIISLDASDVGRLGESYIQWQSTFENTHFVVIDHHISNPLFGDTNIVDAKSGSTCEIIVKIIQELWLEQYTTPEVATFLYTGIQTDSNMYFNTNTRPESLRAGAFLIEQGADFRLPISELYKKRTKNQLLVWKSAFENLEFFENESICMCCMSDKVLQELSIPRDELGNYFKWFISEILINIEGVKIAVLVYPLEKWWNKVSMRSQAEYNVAEICERFGGGGHTQAAGFESLESMEEVRDILIREIKKSI